MPWGGSSNSTGKAQGGPQGGGEAGARTWGRCEGTVEESLLGRGTVSAKALRQNQAWHTLRAARRPVYTGQSEMRQAVDGEVDRQAGPTARALAGVRSGQPGAGRCGRRDQPPPASTTTRRALGPRAGRIRTCFSDGASRSSYCLEKEHGEKPGQPRVQPQRWGAELLALGQGRGPWC